MKISKLLLLFISVFFVIKMQAQKRYLNLNKTISSEIKPLHPDSFYVKMNKGHFASIRITEKEIRIHAQVYDPQDSLIQIVDQNQMGDKEIVSIFSKKSGDYKIKVHWNFSRPYTGKYTITLDKLESQGKTPIQKVAQLFDGYYEKNAPGGAIAIIENGKVIFKATKGMANLEEKISLSSQSVFEMASCAKQFTGFAIAMLIDQGKLNLDDDIRKYLPEMPDYGSTVSIANLVYHTSGIRSTDAMMFAGYTPEDIITLPMCIKFAFAQKALLFKPGERFNYSNTNYNLLAEIIARVTGQSFSSWCKKNIFIPLGMYATFFKENPGEVYANKVLCYKGIKEGYQQRMNNWGAVGGAGLYTNLDDLVKWCNSFDTKQLITPGIEKLLHTQGSLRENGKTRYAFGNEFIESEGQIKINHLGLAIGYRTGIVRYPGKKLAIIYLANDDNDATYQRFNRIQNIILNNTPLEKASLEGFPDAEKVMQDIENDEQYKETIDLSPYIGVYSSAELACVWELTIIDQRLIIKNPRMNDVKLKNTGNDKFGFIEFKRSVDNQVIGLNILGDDIEFIKQY